MSKGLKQFILIAVLGVLLSLGIHKLPQVKAQQSVAPEQSPLALIQAGKKQYDEGKFSEAAQLLQQAVEVYQAQGDRLKQAHALSLVSLAQQRLGKWIEAEETMSTSMAVLETVPNNAKKLPVQAQVLNNGAHLQLAIGKAENALETWREAELFYQQGGDPVGVTGSQINQAQALETLGFYRRSCNQVLEAFEIENQSCKELTVQTLDQVLKSFPSQPDYLQMIGLRSLGNVLRLMGRFEQAQKVLQQSRAIAQQLSSLSAESKTLLSLGNIQQNLAIRAIELNNLEEAEKYSQTALDHYQQAFKLSKLPSNLALVTALQAQLNQLNLLTERENWLDAQNLLPQIQVELDNLPPSRALVYAQVNLAQSLISCKQKKPEVSFSWADIAAILNHAVEDARTIGDKRGQSYALGNLGKLEYEHQLSESLTSQTQLEQALYLAQEENAPEIAYRWQWQLGRIYRDQQARERAIAAYQTALATLEGLRGDLLTLEQEIQFSFREQVEPVYRELVALLLQEENPNQKNLQQARDVIEALQLAEINNFFREACVETKAQGIEEIDPSAGVIYSIILPERLVIILSLPEKPLYYYTRAIDEQDLERVFKALLTVNTNDPLANPSNLDPLVPNQQFYDWLIRPAEGELKNSEVETLVFVLDGLMRSVPIAALHDGQEYLIEKYNLALTPGLQLLGSRSLVSENLKTLAAGLAQPPPSEPAFPPIPGVKREVEEIARILPTQILLDEEFASDRLKSELEAETFPIVHLATHGQFSSQAENTFLLAWDGRVNVKDLDQLLRGEDPIQLLILSACQTATGDKRAALGMAGVAIRSGARSTIATLWSVVDESTAELMIKFYQSFNQQGLTKAQALRQAQLSLLRSSKYHHPYYWAPFVLVGNWL